MNTIKKNLTLYLPYFKETLGIILSLSWALYLTLLTFPALSLKFSNPYEIKGPAAITNFNPQTNVLRYGFFLFGTVSLFLLFFSLYRRARYTFLKALFIATLVLSIALSQTIVLHQKIGNIDMFHDGEQLGVGSGVYTFSQRPYKDQFFIHGAFFDPLVAAAAFSLFGKSLGSLYLLNYILLLLSVTTLFVFISISVKSRPLFFFSCLFIYCCILYNRVDRDLIVAVYLIILSTTISGKLSPQKGLFWASFISFFSLYLSLDKGLYLVLCNLFYLGIIIFQHKKDFIKNTLSFVLGNILAVLLGVIFFSPAGFIEFVRMSFFDIPRMKPYLDEYIYPPFSLDKLYPYWWPLLISASTLCGIAYYLKYRKDKINPNFILVIILSFLGVISYRYALGRSDVVHILYTVQYIFIALFLFMDYVLRFENSNLKYLIIALLALQLYRNPFFDSNRLLSLPAYSASDIKFMLTLPLQRDTLFLTEEQKEVTSYIKNSTSKDDYIFVFTNESAYYYLTQRKSPTRFYTIWFASPNFYEKEALRSLQEKPPKYVIYKSDYFSNGIDGISNSEKTPNIDQWIRDNYFEDTRIQSTQILKR